MIRSGGVYTITCTVNGRRYVGSTSNVYNRWKAHRSWLRLGTHYNGRLQADWDEHGEPAFEFRVVAQVKDATARLAMEQSLIDLYQPHVYGYNRSPSASDNTGTERSEAHRRAISDANRGVPKSEAHRAKLSAAQQAHWAGQEITPELREQMAERGRMGKGRPKSAETRHRMSEAQKGRPKSAEHAAAIRAAKQGVIPKSAKLTPDQAREIKRRLRERASCAALGREFGVSPLTISDIKHGRTWKHIT